MPVPIVTENHLGASKLASVYSAKVARDDERWGKVANHSPPSFVVLVDGAGLLGALCIGVHGGIRRPSTWSRRAAVASKTVRRHLEVLHQLQH